MNHNDFNAAADRFAAANAEWAQRVEVDALQRTHVVLEAEYGIHAPTPSSRQKSAEVDVADAWGDSGSDTDAIAPPRHDTADAIVTVRVSWSPSYRMPVVHFDVRDRATSVPIYDAAALSQTYYGSSLNVDGDKSESGFLITRSPSELTGKIHFLIHPCDLHDMLLPYMAALTSRDVGPADLHHEAIKYVVSVVRSALHLR